MKRMITALCAMMLVPTLAAAKNEGISVTELREQIEKDFETVKNGRVYKTLIPDGMKPGMF